MLSKHTLKLIALSGMFFTSFAIQAQANDQQNTVGQSTTIKNQKRMNYKVNIGKIDVPKASIEEFRKQSSQTPIYLKTLSGFVKGDYYEMTDESGNLHMVSVTTWENSEYYERAQAALKNHYAEIHFNRMEFVQRLGLTIKYDAYSVLEMN